jgi:hypothetical protein
MLCEKYVIEYVIKYTSTYRLKKKNIFFRFRNLPETHRQSSSREELRDERIAYYI